MTRRIGSDEARTWARKIRFGDVRAKSILMAICNYVDEDACAYPGIPTLAQDTDQSDDSVRRRLRDLEQYKVIVRFPRFIDGNGKVNTEGRGRRTSDEIRLLLDKTQADVDAAKEEMEQGAEADPRQQQGARQQGSDDAVTLAGSEGGPRTAATTQDSSEPIQQDNPPTPLKGGFEPDDQVWEEFEAAFTADGTPIARQSLAEQLLATLSKDEAVLVTKAASGYVAWRKTEKNLPAKMSAQTFIRERGSWAKWAAFAPAPPQPPPAFVAEDEPLFKALSVVHRIRTGDRLQPPPPPPGESRRGVRTRVKPSPDLLALAPFDGVDAWVDIDASDAEGRKRLAAWRSRITGWTGLDVEPQRINATDADGNPLTQNISGYVMPVRKEILRVPIEWPPRKDGTIAEIPALT